MSLRHFLNAAYALFVEMYQNIPGKTLFDAIEFTNEAFGMDSPKIVSIEAQNEASLQQLTAMMRGV